MAIPEQIRKQTEAVKELYKQLNPESESGEVSAETTDEQVEAPEAVQAADENSVSEDAAPPPASEQKPGGSNVSEETVLQKYKTLQGMYNAEVPRLHQQNKDLSQRLQQLEQLLASVSAQEKKPTQPTFEKLISDKDVEEYGESIDVMRRVSREELSAVAQRLAAIENALQHVQSNVVPQLNQVAHKQAVSAEQQFWSDLSTAVPNWRDINGNEAFQSWLLESDPLTGITRQTYLEDAQRSLDPRRVANFFHAWLEMSGQAAVAQSKGQASNSELEKQVSPGRSRNTGTPASNKAKMYTPQDITKFFNDVRQGKYKGRETERDRIERDIFAAQRENRIQINA